tara:strand:- start:11691 stop:12707 length:1017 start_codon:yes stop_codon:yes gene_type:complete
MPNIDSVYKTVLLILNKEQRGYMTPDEFNRIGSQVQREIFETYFEDLNQQVRVQQTEYDYSNRVFNTDEKVSEFKTEKSLTKSNGKFPLPDDLYRINTLTHGDFNEVTRLTRNEYYNIAKSPLTKPDEKCPVYLLEDNKVIVYPESLSDNIKVQYVKAPLDIRWGYEKGSLGQFLFTDYEYKPNGFIPDDYDELVTTNTSTDGESDALLNVPSSNITCNNVDAVLPEMSIENDSNGKVTAVNFLTTGSNFSVGDEITIDVNFPGNNQPNVSGQVLITVTGSGFMLNSTNGYIDFQLHDSERQELILKILLYAGIVIRDPQIIQTSMQQIQQEAVNEKQ